MAVFVPEAFYRLMICRSVPVAAINSNARWRNSRLRYRAGFAIQAALVRWWQLSRPLVVAVVVPLMACTTPDTRPTGATASPSAATRLKEDVDRWLDLGNQTGSGGAESAALAFPMQSDALPATPKTSEGVPEPSPEIPKFTLTAVDLPLRTLFTTLAAEAHKQLLLDIRANPRVSLHLEDQPLESVLEHIALLAPVIWEIRQNLLLVHDRPVYLKTYTVDYLNISRHTHGSVGLATQVGSISLQGVGSEGSGAVAPDTSGNSSEARIDSESRHAFWESLQQSLEMIVRGGTGDGNGQVQINREAGLVVARANAGQHRQITQFLQSLQRIVHRQVQIQATVVEVTLSNQYQAGIDWQALAGNSDRFAFAQAFHGLNADSPAALNALPTPSGLLSATLGVGNTDGRVSMALNLLETFGDVRILSRPQIMAVNNQSAVLKVVDNHVYFSTRVDQRFHDDQQEIQTETRIHTVPVGLVMSVTAFVGEDDRVLLNVRPTISRILGMVNDPNPALAAANVRNAVPEIQVREMESVLQVEDGQTVMIGGLMQHRMNDDRQGLPGLGSLPGVGRLFRNNASDGRKTELLVFLQPRIID